MDNSVWNYIIFNYLDFYSQIRFKSVCRSFNEAQITNLYDIPDKVKSKLTDKILLNFSFVTKLNAYDNLKITSVNHMTKLLELDAQGNCGIGDNGIQCCSLIKLYADDNPKITKQFILKN